MQWNYWLTLHDKSTITWYNYWTVLESSFSQTGSSAGLTFVRELSQSHFLRGKCLVKVKEVKHWRRKVPESGLKDLYTQRQEWNSHRRSKEIICSASERYLFSISTTPLWYLLLNNPLGFVSSTIANMWKSVTCVKLCFFKYNKCDKYVTKCNSLCSECVKFAYCWLKRG